MDNLSLIHKTDFKEWSSEKFWEDCEGNYDTLVIIKTNYNKIIGGYSPIEWSEG